MEEQLTVDIRYAVREDCKDLMALIRELAVYEKAEHEVTVSLEAFEEAGFGVSPVWKSFVALHEGKVIGMALYYTRYSTWKGCRLYLEDFLVTEPYRGKGVGKLLFEKVIGEASQAPYQGMSWQVLDWNEPAIRFYQRYKADFDGGWLNASISEDKLKK